jgi:hypothetical protein
MTQKKEIQSHLDSNNHIEKKTLKQFFKWYVNPITITISNNTNETIKNVKINDFDYKEKKGIVYYMHHDIMDYNGYDFFLRELLCKTIEVNHIFMQHNMLNPLIGDEQYGAKMYIGYASSNGNYVKVPIDRIVYKRPSHIKSLLNKMFKEHNIDVDKHIGNKKYKKYKLDGTSAIMLDYLLPNQQITFSIFTKKLDEIK